MKKRLEERTINQQARETQEQAKQQRKTYFDNRTNAKDHNIKVGDTVLLKQRKQNKLSTAYEPKQYKVTATNHNMITATDSSGQYTRTRNVSHFRPTPPLHFKQEEQDPEEITEERTPDITQAPPVNPARRYPIRDRKPVNRYDGQYP